MSDTSLLFELENKIVVKKEPFPFSTAENFLPKDLILTAEKEFNNFSSSIDDGNARYQKFKSGFANYEEMPNSIKKIIELFYSKGFIKILEKKFELEEIEPDWKLHGGGMHQSNKNGYLKVHSDFIYRRKSKQRRVLNLLLYLNSDWQKEWNGSLELWDKNMTEIKEKIEPKLNNVVIFRTDQDSNHGFPDPLKCPTNVSRNSIALYYYVKEKSFFPYKIKRRKFFHAVWKKRPNTNEPIFADQDSFFKRLKHKFFYRFF